MRSRPLRWAVRACAKVRQCDMDKVLEPEMPPSIHLCTYKNLHVSLPQAVPLPKNANFVRLT